MEQSASRYVKSFLFANPVVGGEYPENICLVAWIEDAPPGFNLRVKRLNDSYGRWTNLGDAIGALYLSQASFDVIADGAGTPFVAFVQSGRFGEALVKVGQWDGQQWNVRVLNVDWRATAQQPTFALESNGALSLSWTEHRGNAAPVAIKRIFNGTDWVAAP